ncbi:MAG: DNA cytosine methyltransferase [Rhodocyclaceae bacterium]|nr:DNA cytosine methyltransferase [Rhodocyclaceae bacterium]
MKRDRAFTATGPDVREIRHFHLFCGLGGGASGFNRANPRVGNMVGRFRCIGGVDVDPAAIRDFSRLAGVEGTVLDLFDRDQYLDFHGCEPPAGWREVGPEAIRAAAGGEYPSICFLSAPCKGFSGLLAEGRSRTAKYQALNRLTVRGVWLMLEAFADDPPELVVFENVPRIGSRGRPLLDQIGDLLQAYGYAVAETTHDCGELGGLAQSRKRFLLVARHIAKVPPFLYEPPGKRLQSVGTVLERMLLPGDMAAGPMHRVPRLQWKTWVRLAFVEAGRDWRSLNRLAIEDGMLRDYLIVPEMHAGTLGVRRWEDALGTITGNARPATGAFSVADPRFVQSAKWRDGQALGVRRWDESTGTVAGQQGALQGAYSVADPRGNDFSAKYRVTRWDASAGTVISASTTGQGAFVIADPRHEGPPKHNNVYRVVRWDEAGRAVTGAHGSGQCIADPRCVNWHPGASRKKLAVTSLSRPAGTVIGAQQVASGALAVADPRPGLARDRGDAYLTAGHYGVVPWASPCGAVSAAAGHDNGRWSIADPRLEPLPAARDQVVAQIIAEDGTWHRPFTTLELAALQSLVDPEEQLELDGLSDSAWRERIGNAVPPAAAKAIAEVMGTTLLLAWSGETFVLSATPIWVRPVAVALSVAQGPQ